MTSTELPVSRLTIERSWIVGVAVTAILLGLIATVFPGAVLLTVAIVFGISLIVSGFFQLIVAFTAERFPGRVRWLYGVLGGLVVIAGILCLSNPFRSLSVLGVVIGLGWMLNGVASIVGGTIGEKGGPRWLSIASGIVWIVGGLLVVIIPVAGLASFVLVSGILLVIIGAATLLLLTRSRRASTAEAAPVRTP
ncbi:DUF308 domain-containing protein [Glaciihabitans sp. UYNi722]|uniref:HdeD family acid-resistance protein n=1 Tax=Glaciihabitans sp. UYNi722 TaxID=3156344 RepID=UPI003395F22C